MTLAIEFDPVLHRYQLNGRELPPVTRVIESVLRSHNPYWKSEHQIRGRLVHAILEAIDEGDFDPGSTVFPSWMTQKLRDNVLGCGEAYKVFLENTGFKAIARELPVWSEVMGVAGTLDYAGTFTKGKYAGRFGIVDAKSGSPTPAAQLQVALYQLCLRESYPQLDPVQVRVVLRVCSNGKPRPEYYSSNQDLVDATSLVNVYYFLKRNGLFDG